MEKKSDLNNTWKELKIIHRKKSNSKYKSNFIRDKFDYIKEISNELNITTN